MAEEIANHYIWNTAPTPHIPRETKQRLATYIEHLCIVNDLAIPHGRTMSACVNQAIRNVARHGRIHTGRPGGTP